MSSFWDVRPSFGCRYSLLQRPSLYIADFLRQMHSVGLMNAILALSARHLSITQHDTPADSGGDRPDPNDAVDYYLKTLHYSQRALQYDTYKTSPELLAISIIVSSYEMLGGSSANWGKHLEGVFWIQRSQVIHGDTGGLRQAVWWTWLCQDVWAAFREKRKPFTFWAPSRTLAELNPVEIAARSVYNYAKVVGFCSADAMGNGRDVSARTLEADVLLQQLEEWRTYLTLEFDPLPSSLSRQGSGDVFPAVWIQPSVFGKLVFFGRCLECSADGETSCVDAALLLLTHPGPSSATDVWRPG